MHLKAKYPDKLFDLEGIGKQMDLSEFSRNFFSSKVTSDSSIDANSNVDDTSIITYTVELPKPFFKLNSYYILWKELKRIYNLETANTIIEKQLVGDIYIHDFYGFGAGIPYCFNYSTYDIMTKGLPMVGKVRSIPPKHLHAFKSQLEQFVIIAANSTLGATGLADLLIVMSYYVKNILETQSDAHAKFSTKEDCWTYVKEMLTSFIYSINFSLRANQSPFVNLSLYDRLFLETMCPDYIFPDGTNPNIDIIEKLQQIYVDIMNTELERTPLTFPVTTACFSVDEDNNIRDEAFLNFIAESDKKYGFINIFCGKSSILSACCRLRSDTKNEYFNSFGSGTTKIGSLGVCTINFPRLAVKSQGEQTKFFSLLKEELSVASKVNNAKRHLIEKRIKNGNEPLYTHGFMDLSRQYSTTGVNGLNECVELMGLNILEETGQTFVLDTLDIINASNDTFQKLYNAPHNVEQVPGENSSIKIAEKDKLLGYQDKYDIYSNQFIPLTTNASLLDRIRLQGMFDKHFSGGAICHLNVESKIEDTGKLKKLILVAAKAGVIYFAINYNLQECEEGHMSVGRKDTCATCGKPIINNYSRVVGFLTNTKNWHKVRRDLDYPNRKFYKELE